MTHARIPYGIWNSWGWVQCALEKQVLNKVQIPQFFMKNPNGSVSWSPFSCWWLKVRVLKSHETCLVLPASSHYLTFYMMMPTPAGSSPPITSGLTSTSCSKACQGCQLSPNLCFLGTSYYPQTSQLWCCCKTNLALTASPSYLNDIKNFLCFSVTLSSSCTTLPCLTNLMASK
jgi:hypothetical protein